MGLRQGSSEAGDSDQKSVWLPAVGATLVIVVLAALGETGRTALAYHREGIAEGEVWRLVTGHFVHTGFPHLALNLAGLWVVWYLVGATISLAGWTLVWLASIAAVDAGLWLFEPGLQWYVGLSGVLHGLIAAGVIRGLQCGRPEFWIVVAALVGKLVYEQLVGPLPGSELSTGDAVIVDAHLYGTLAGAAAGAFLAIRVRAGASI